MIRDRQMVIRLTEKEHYYVSKYVAEEGKTLSDHIRDLVINPIIDYYEGRLANNDRVIIHRLNKEGKDEVEVGTYIGSLSIDNEVNHVIETEDSGLGLYDWSYTIAKIDEGTSNDILNLLKSGSKFELEDYTHLL